MAIFRSHPWNDWGPQSHFLQTAWRSFASHFKGAWRLSSANICTPELQWAQRQWLPFFFLTSSSPKGNYVLWYFYKYFQEMGGRGDVFPLKSLFDCISLFAPFHPHPTRITQQLGRSSLRRTEPAFSLSTAWQWSLIAHTQTIPRKS